MSGSGYLDGSLYRLCVCRTDRVHHRQLSVEERLENKASEQLVVSRDSKYVMENREGDSLDFF